MPVTVNLRNTMLDAIPSTVYVGAFNGDPEGAGSAVSARGSQTLAAASGGSRAASNQPALSITGGDTVGWLAWYDAVTGGNLLATADVTDEAFGSNGTYTVTATTFTLNNA